MTAHASTQIRPRPLFCVIEHAYRDRRIAEDVCAGKFTENGVTLDLGLDPNWLLAGLSHDEEWQIAWIKFYFGLDLAAAYAETGEARFQHAWEKLVASWIRQVPVEFGPTDAIGRRIQNWIYAWNIFADSPHFAGLSEGLDEKLVASLAQQTRYLRNHLTAERNHRTLELYSLLIAALALPEAALDADLLEFAMEAFYQNLLADVRPDGVHREHSTHYHMMVLRSYLGARENVRRFGLSFPRDYDERLERACEFAMHCHRPDGGIPMLSDSDEGNYSDLLRLAASLLSRPDFLYAATAGSQGVPPQKRYVNFPDAGYYTQRSGWGTGQTAFEQENFLIFDCGPLGDGGHGHYDMLNVEIAGGGKSLIIDPGRYTYSEHPPNFRHWFKGTAAHNTVCIDGLDQVAYRRGKPKKPLPQARLIERWSAPGFDLLCGTAQSPRYEVIHTRRIFFIADEYWIICDSLAGERPHRFDLRFHLAPEAWERTQILGNNIRTPELALVFSGASRLQIEPGWLAPLYGVKQNAPVVSAVIEGTNSAEFATVIMASDPTRHAPELKILHSPTAASPNFALEISGTGADRSSTDYVAWSPSIADHVIASFQCRAAAVWSRSAEQKEDTRFVACYVQECRSHRDNQIVFVAASHPAAWVSWEPQHGLTSGAERFE
jgi:heparinase II/III-like protein